MQVQVLGSEEVGGQHEEDGGIQEERRRGQGLRGIVGTILSSIDDSPEGPEDEAQASVPCALSQLAIRLKSAPSATMSRAISVEATLDRRSASQEMVVPAFWPIRSMASTP